MQNKFKEKKKKLMNKIHKFVYKGKEKLVYSVVRAEKGG